MRRRSGPVYSIATASLAPDESSRGRDRAGSTLGVGDASTEIVQSDDGLGELTDRRPPVHVATSPALIRRVRPEASVLIRWRCAGAGALVSSFALLRMLIPSVDLPSRG